MKDIINIGIVAHIDAGKTTITEQLLYFSGSTRSAGSVDKGTAQTDFMDIERNRGISVRTASTAIQWKDVSINLIDTPGHIDFAPNAERALQVLDCAVLVVSAVEGVEARTELLWRILEQLKIPVILYVNKVDRLGADLEGVKDQIKNYLTSSIAIIQPVSQEGTEQFEVFDAFTKEEGKLALIESIAEFDEEVLEEYFVGNTKISREILLKKLKKGCEQRTVFPLLCGSAIKGIGIEGLLDAIVALCPRAKEIEGEPSGIIFNIDHDKLMGRVAHIRLYRGSLKNRDSVLNHTAQCEEKITQIRKFYGQKYEDIGHLESGDIGALCGFNHSRVGDIIGSPNHLPKNSIVTEPLLQVRVNPENDSEYSKLVESMHELVAEDPLLNLVWVKEERQLLIHITGLIQLEVLGEILRKRFGLNVHFGDPVVIYKETPAKDEIGFVSYTMPKPCWAVLKFEIKPAPKGSGVIYSSEVPNNKIYYRYQNQVEKTIKSALQQGLYGWEVTDLYIKLVDGEHHIEHTHPLDFIVATPMGIMDGLKNTGTVLLEPMLQFRITVPEETCGKLMSEIIHMRGQFESPIIKGDRAIFEGEYPVATSMEFPIRLSALTSGRGNLSVSFGGYQPCPIELGATTPYRGVNPLDRSKYILSIRSALQG